MKLAVVGSTALGDKRSRTLIEETIQQTGATCIVSGGAKGIDQLGVLIGRERGLQVIEFIPEVRQWKDRDGKKGFETRNLEIATECDVLLRIFWDVKEQKQMTGKTTFGSGWTALQALKMGKQVIAHSLTLAQDRGYV